MHGIKIFRDEKSITSFTKNVEPDSIEREQARRAEKLKADHDVQGTGHWKILCRAAAAAEFDSTCEKSTHHTISSHDFLLLTHLHLRFVASIAIFLLIHLL